MSYLHYALMACLLATSFPSPAQAATFKPQCGNGSWYAMTSRTASGERANPNAMTAAHRRLPFGTKVRVTNLRNGKSVILRINDRGPFTKGRVIDVTRLAAQKLGFKRAGWAPLGISPVSHHFVTGKGCRAVKS